MAGQSSAAAIAATSTVTNTASMGQMRRRTASSWAARSEALLGPLAARPSSPAAPSARPCAAPSAAGARRRRHGHCAGAAAGARRPAGRTVLAVEVPAHAR